MSDSWSDLMAGNLDQDAAEKLLRKGLAHLDSVLDAQPHAYEDILAIVEKTLSQPFDEGTIFTLSDTLSSYLQSDSGQIILWVVYDRAARLRKLSELDSPRAFDLVRRISTSYGRQLSRATQVSNGWKDDWDWISLSVAYDQGISIYRLKIDLTKVTGERIRIESPPESLMSLTTYLLGMLRDVGTKDAFSEATRQAFSDRVEEVRRILNPEPAPPAKAAASAATAKGH